MRHQRYFRWETAPKFAGALALLLELSAIMWAAVGGSLSGTITGSSGAAIAGARVVAVSATQGLQTKVGTDAKGAYRFPVLSVGQYDLKVEAPGYKPSVHKIVIHVDDKVRLDVVLESDTPAASAPVERFANRAKALTQGVDDIWNHARYTSGFPVTISSPDAARAEGYVLSR